MKQKWHRLCNRRRWIPVVVVTAVLAPFLVIDATVGGGITVITWVLAGVTILLSTFTGAGHGARLMNPTVLTLHDQCDPYPLLAETEDQLGYVKNRGSRQLLTVNRAAALIELGRFEDALTALEALNIDDPAPLPIVRYVYYHNAALTAMACGQREKAEVYARKAEHQAPSVKGKQWQAMLDYTAQALYIEMRLADGDYDAARRALEHKTELPHTMARVHHEYQWARMELAQGNASAARFHLDFVALYGNKLAVADEARKTLEEINA